MEDMKKMSNRANTIRNTVEDLLTPDKIIKEELDPIQIKEEPSADEIGENITENPTDFLAVNIKTEEVFSDEELVTDDDAVTYMLSNGVETEFIDVGQELFTGETFIKKENTECKQSPSPDPISKSKLKSISFIHAVSQIEKHYQIKQKPNTNEFKNYYILTSSQEHNDFNTDWKLFIPGTSNPFPTLNLENIVVNCDPKSARFYFAYSSNNLIVKQIKDLTSFMQGILGGKILLVTDQNVKGISDQFTSLQNLQPISNQFETNCQNGNQLIPSFTIKADESFFIFPTAMETIGNEEVPKISEENYAHLIMLTSSFFCKPKLTINGVPYQLTSPSVRLLPSVCDDASKAYEENDNISDIKEKYATGQYITVEELDRLVKVLETKIMKTPFEKQEIKRLKTRRRNRKSREKMSEEQTEAKRKQVREQKRAQLYKMNDDDKQILRKKVREQKKARYHQMSEEEREVLRKRVREQKKVQYHQMSAEQKEALRKRDREMKKARYNHMCEEQKEALRKRDREQKKARSIHMVEEEKQTINTSE